MAVRRIRSRSSSYDVGSGDVITTSCVDGFADCTRDARKAWRRSYMASATTDGCIVSTNISKPCTRLFNFSTKNNNIINLNMYTDISKVFKGEDCKVMHYKK